jgi:UDP-N-acetyl-D-glucosamine dehydrogenase
MLRKYDCVLVSTDHASYDRTFIAKHARLIFDTRRAFRDIKSNKIVRL